MCVADIGPASVIVGNLVQGNRLASAQGRDMGLIDDESDSGRKVKQSWTAQIGINAQVNNAVNE